MGQTGLVNNSVDIASSYTNAVSNYKLESSDSNWYAKQKHLHSENAQQKWL